MIDSQFDFFWEQYLSGTISNDDRKKLMQFVLEKENEVSVTGKIQFLLDQINNGTIEITKKLPYIKAEEVFNDIKTGRKLSPVVPIERKVNRSWLWIAAASVIFLVCISIGVLVRNESSKTPLSGTNNTHNKQDAPPGTNGAILTLANGQQIVLDTIGNGAIAQQNGATVINLNGILSYDSVAPDNVSVSYNTISTPRGRQYQLILADGSKVWLNAASSLRFPTAFVTKERVVELTGEAYFEVAHNAARPFHVSISDIDVQVLGTRFNINAYTNELARKTTLVEGSVLINADHLKQSSILKPGQQAVVNGKALTVHDDANISDVLAWKDGQFALSETDFSALMRQIERWYDVDVIYESKIPEMKFGGYVDMSVNLSVVIQALNESQIKCRLEGKKLIVK